MRYLVAILALAGLAAMASAQSAATSARSAVKAASPAKAKPAPRKAPEKTPEADQPDSTGLYNAALLELGASAKGSGSRFNKDWPPDSLLQRVGRGGVLIGFPLKGGRVDIRLIIPVDIKAIEVVPLDYHGTQQPKAIDIFVEGKLVKHAELEHNPGKVQRIELEGQGQNVGILITDEYPLEDLPDGQKGAAYGGWSRLRVLTTTNVAEKMKVPGQYDVKLSADNIAPTTGSLAEGKVEVIGQPRETKGHPCTIWDNEDIAHYKEMLKTNKELQKQFAGLKNAMDIRLTQPVGVVPAQKDAAGNWRHIGDQELAPDGRKIGELNNQLSLDIANLGEVYVLTGEAKYAEFAKKLLLAYADNYPNYAVGARPGFAHSPSKIYDQTMSDATWLIPIAKGYDLIHDLPSITPEERKHIEDDLVKCAAKCVCSNHAMIEAATNWSALSTCSVLLAGYATDDQDLINIAMYGLHGGTKEKPTGGLFDRHFTKAVAPDGLWIEGAMGYQFMALDALVADAEILWHHGIDMYSYNDCAMKKLFDSPLRFSYPDLTEPALHDSGHGSIIGSEAFLYEFAYRRYHDPTYLLVLNQCGRHLDTHFQEYVVSVLYDRDRNEKQAAVEWKNVNFFSVGYGILRVTTPAGNTGLLLEYGPTGGSHGHPDKLCLDLYAFNNQLMIDPGSAWYETAIFHQWYHTTLSHNTLVVDERDQVMCGGKQLVYAPAETMGMERASCTDAYPGMTMDRASFLTPDYVADIFGAVTGLPRKFDLAWHLRGQFASDLKLEPTTLPEPRANGYIALTNVRKSEPTDQAWTAAITTPEGQLARFLAAGGTKTEVIVGDGHYGLETPPSIIERRENGSTIYGNVIDISGDTTPFVKSVKQEGSLEAGYGLLRVETTRGIDLCFSSFRPGEFGADGISSDAQQAFVQMDGKNVKAMYLAGGKSLKAGGGMSEGGAILTRSEPGLAYVEKMVNGGYIVANPSPTDATVSVALAPLANMDAFNLDPQGRRTGPATVKAGSDKFFVVDVTMKAASKVEFAAKGAPSIYDVRQAMLKKRQDEQEAQMHKAHDECVARTTAREAEAKATPAPANTVVVVAAKDFSAEGNGKIGVTNKKMAIASGSCINMWGGIGQWLEWTFDVPADGFYNLTMCYCSDDDLAQREIKINGELQEPFAPIVCPATGGWAGGSDDWRLYTATNPTNDQPLLLKFKQGKNVVRLTNLNGRGTNVDYLAVTSPDVKPTRELLAGKLAK